MKAAESYALAQKIIKKCDGSRDPEIIYQCLGIELEDTFDLANLKGMYSSADRHRQKIGSPYKASVLPVSDVPVSDHGRSHA